MTHRNNVTGDLIFDKKPTKAYLDNYDAIFRKKGISDAQKEQEPHLPEGYEEEAESFSEEEAKVLKEFNEV